MKTSHREKLTGHTGAILEEILAMFCNSLRSSGSLKSQQIDPFHRRCGRAYRQWRNLSHSGAISGNVNALFIILNNKGNAVFFLCPFVSNIEFRFKLVMDSG